MRDSFNIKIFHCGFVAGCGTITLKIYGATGKNKGDLRVSFMFRGLSDYIMSRVAIGGGFWREIGNRVAKDGLGRE